MKLCCAARFGRLRNRHGSYCGCRGSFNDSRDSRRDSRRSGNCSSNPNDTHDSRRSGSCSGQATVEYLIVGLAIMAIISGLTVIGSRLQEGLFAEHAADSASHAITSNTAGSLGDILLY